MTKIHLTDIEPREIVPGYFGRFIHSETMTVAYWDIKAGESLQMHSHEHEQILNMLEGEFELTVEGEPMHLKPGDIFVLKSHVKHGGKAISDCKILDVFQPVRADYT